MSRTGINHETGDVNVYELLPHTGDSMTITNCGTHFELRYQHQSEPFVLALTQDELNAIFSGKMIFH